MTDDRPMPWTRLHCSPLNPTKIRLAALQAVLASVEGGWRPETFDLPLGLARKFTVPPEYVFAERLLRGEGWESLCIAFDLSPEEAFGKLVRLARGATSSTWERTYRQPSHPATRATVAPTAALARKRARRKGGQ